MVHDAAERAMNATATRWSRWLLTGGLACMLLGALDPLEGSLVILPGTGLAALGAFLGEVRRRRLLYWALALVAIGVAALWGLSALGGLGGSTGRSYWWGLLFLPYPIGWIMGLAGAVLTLVESYARRAQPGQGGATA